MLLCPDHQQPFKTIPAGVSRSTGRPYPAFKVCSVEGCKRREEDGIEVEKFDTPAKHILDEVPTAAETVMTKKEWLEKEERTRRQAVRQSQMSTLLGQGMSLKEAFKQGLDLPAWENYVLTGKNPEQQDKEIIDEILGE